MNFIHPLNDLFKLVFMFIFSWKDKLPISIINRFFVYINRDCCDNFMKLKSKEYRKNNSLLPESKSKRFDEEESPSISTSLSGAFRALNVTSKIKIVQTQPWGVVLDINIYIWNSFIGISK